MANAMGVVSSKVAAIVGLSLICQQNVRKNRHIRASGIMPAELGIFSAIFNVTVPPCVIMSAQSSIPMHMVISCIRRHFFLLLNALFNQQQDRQLPIRLLVEAPIRLLCNVR